MIREAFLYDGKNVEITALGSGAPGFLEVIKSAHQLLQRN